MDSKIIKLGSVISDAIRTRRVIKFPFESEDGNTGDRIIKPYMLYVNDQKKIRVVGLPRERWDLPTGDKKKKPGQYLLDKIDLKQLKVLSETFNDPGVPREIVVTTKIVKIICRFIYDDEDEEEVMKTWVKLEDL